MSNYLSENFTISIQFNNLEFMIKVSKRIYDSLKCIVSHICVIKINEN